MVSKADTIHWGGGVVAEFSVVSKSPRDSVGGGGVVSEFFRGPQNPAGFSGGGGGESTMSFSFVGPLLHYTFPKGGPGPP